MSYFNRNKWTAIAFLLLIALNIVTLSTFWLMREKGMSRPAGNQPALVDFLVKELGLDSAQKKQLIVLRDEHRQQMQAIRRNNRDAKNAFFDLLQKENLTDTALAAAAKEAARYDAETDMLTFRHFQQIRALCNAEQKVKFESVIRQVLRMMAPPPPGRSQGGPPTGRDGEKQDGPPPGEEGQAPPPPRQ